MIDTAAPTGSIVINGGAEATDDVNVTLGLNATDELSGVGRMRIAETTDALSAADFKSFSETDDFTLSDYDGVKTVYAQFEDAAGNKSEIVSDTITLQPTPYDEAKLSISINAKWFDVGDTAVVSGFLKDISGKGLARHHVKIKARGKIIGTVRTEVGGGYLFEHMPEKTTPYKGVFINKSGKKINTHAVVAHIKRHKKSLERVEKIIDDGKNVDNRIHDGSKKTPGDKGKNKSKRKKKPVDKVRKRPDEEPTKKDGEKNKGSHPAPSPKKNAKPAVDKPQPKDSIAPDQGSAPGKNNPRKGKGRGRGKNKR